MSLEDMIFCLKPCEAALKMQLKALNNNLLLLGKQRLASAASLEKYASCCHEDTPAAEENRPAAV
jgi:hypothetical protein